MGKLHIVGPVTISSYVYLCGGGCELNLTYAAFFHSISFYYSGESQEAKNF